MANNILVPTIFGQAINERLGTNLLARHLAFDATPLVPEILIAGDSINLPILNRVANTSLVTKGTPLVPANVDMSPRLTEIRHAATSIRIFDQEAVQIKGEVVDNMVEQVSTSIAKFVDTSLITEMSENKILETPLANPDVVTNAEMLTAMSLFGDARNVESFAGILCSSVMLNSFLTMPEFISATITFNTNGQGDSVINGLITNNIAGWYLGIPIFISDQAGNEIFVIKKLGLGYFIQRDVKIEIEREAKLLADDIVASVLFGVKLLEPDFVSVLTAPSGGNGTG